MMPSNRFAELGLPSCWYRLGDDEPQNHARRYSAFGEIVLVMMDGRAFSDTRPYELHRANGTLYCWTGPEAPIWHPPEFDMTGWSRWSGRHLYEFDSHPQDLCENAADTSHFGQLHQFGGAQLDGRPECHDQCLTMRYRSTWSLDRLNYPALRFNLKYAITLHGLGFSHTEVSISHRYLPGELRFRVLMECTPLELGRIRVSIRVAGYNVVPKFGEAMKLFGQAATLREFEADINIWEKKSYMPDPMYVAGDGMVAYFRNWAKRFY